MTFIDVTLHKKNQDKVIKVAMKRKFL